jgi:hypothetical protein
LARATSSLRGPFSVRLSVALAASAFDFCSATWGASRVDLDENVAGFDRSAFLDVDGGHAPADQRPHAHLARFDRAREHERRGRALALPIPISGGAGGDQQQDDDDLWFHLRAPCVQISSREST